MWRNLGNAALLYEARGWKWLDAEWAVKDDACRMTLPSGMEATKVTWQNADTMSLVGSAEQSFIDLMLRNSICSGKWQAITPCFRNESYTEPARRNVFIKLELFLCDMQSEKLQGVISDAAEVMYVITGIMPNRVINEDGYDLEINGIEVGSYGCRKVNGRPYIFGTGCAEPRMTFASER